MFSLGVWRCRKYSNLYSPRFFVTYNPATSGGGYKVTIFMKKLLFGLSLSAVLSLFGCTSTTSEEDPAVIGTTVRAAAFFSEAGKTEELTTLVVGRTYAVNFWPFCSPSVIDFVRGSVTKVNYCLVTPYEGKQVIGTSETEPFTIQYVPKSAGTCYLSAEVELSPKDANKWVEVETLVKVVEAGE